MKTPDRPTVVFCGAGISIGPPSSLPSAADLARKAVDLLLASADIVLDAAAITALAEAIRRMRLELILERLSLHVDAATLVQVYSMLRGAALNFNHLALAAADLAVVVTTNQDILLEAAADRLFQRREVVHLHGRCDRPETIVTMLSQYMSGLDPEMARRLRDAIEDQHLLVMGYSGRDPDVMEVIEEARPARVRWLLHTGAEVSPELAKLRRRLGTTLEIETASAADALAALLSPEQRAAVDHALAGESERPRDVTPETRERFAAIDRVDRNLGLASILTQAAHYDEAGRVFAALGGLRSGTPIAVRLAAATALAHQMRFDEAIDAYETVAGAPDASPLQRCFALMGEVGALRDTSRGARAAAKLRQLDELLALAPPSRQRSRLHGRAASEGAGIARVEGDLGAALAGYSAAWQAFSDSRDLGERLESVVWRADVLRLQGRYLQAHEEIVRAREDSLLYVRYIAQAWALFVSADIDCARGDLRQCETALDQSWDHFFAPGERQSIVWNLLLRSTLRRASGQLDGAEAALEDAAARMARSPIPRHFARVRWGLERADLARARGDAPLMARSLEETRQLLATSQHFASRPQYLLLHARLVEAEAQRAEASPAAAAELTSLAQQYERLGFHGCAARARTGAWLCTAGAPPPRDLLDDCRAHGRQHEIERLEGRAAGFYPIVFA